MRYSWSAADSQRTKILGYSQGHYIQYVADNVNHNVATIDGAGTFHGIGIIAAVTPGTRADMPVPKVHVTAAAIAKVGCINIQCFKIPPVIEPIIYRPLVHIAEDYPTSQLDVLWKPSLLLHSPRSTWSLLSFFWKKMRSNSFNKTETWI